MPRTAHELLSDMWQCHCASMAASMDAYNAEWPLSRVQALWIEIDAALRSGPQDAATDMLSNLARFKKLIETNGVLSAPFKDVAAEWERIGAFLAAMPAEA